MNNLNPLNLPLVPYPAAERESPALLKAILLGCGLPFREPADDGAYPLPNGHWLVPVNEEVTVRNNDGTTVRHCLWSLVQRSTWYREPVNPYQSMSPESTPELGRDRDPRGSTTPMPAAAGDAGGRGVSIVEIGLFETAAEALTAAVVLIDYERARAAVRRLNHRISLTKHL